MPLPGLPRPGDPPKSSPRRSQRARVAIRIAATLVALLVLLLIVGTGLSTWRGSGFRANGPELPRLRNVLALKAGMSVADVGAGNGELTVALASEVGSTGRVYSTDLDLKQVRATVAAARLSNVTFVQSQTDDTSLPRDCCDAIVVRRVYHHLTDPVAINRSLLRALRPGGVLAVIDFPPLVSWLWALNHGVDARRVTEEVVASGFQLVRIIEDWPGRGPLENYCAVFSKPRDSRVSAARSVPGSRALRRRAGRFYRSGVDPPRCPDNAVYLIRPDGHVAFRCRGTNLDGLAGFLSQWLTTAPSSP